MSQYLVQTTLVANHMSSLLSKNIKNVSRYAGALSCSPLNTDVAQRKKNRRIAVDYFKVKTKQKWFLTWSVSGYSYSPLKLTKTPKLKVWRLSGSCTSSIGWLKSLPNFNVWSRLGHRTLSSFWSKKPAQSQCESMTCHMTGSNLIQPTLLYVPRFQESLRIYDTKSI